MGVGVALMWRRGKRLQELEVSQRVPSFEMSLYSIPVLIIGSVGD